MGVVVTKNVNIKDVNKELQQVLDAFFFLLFLISHHGF